jgi:thiamine pyrophosphokinase
MPAEAGVERTIIILSGGGLGPSPDQLPQADLVIAADSGLALADALGLAVDVVVGDLDSALPADLDAARKAGAVIELHPTDKDATDLDLAMTAAIERGAERIVVVGGGAGRLDHLLGVATLLASDRWADVRIEWHTPATVVYPTRLSMEISTEAGDLVSLIPLSGDAAVTLLGTRWELQTETIAFGSSRGISNEAKTDLVHLQVHSGVVLLAHTRGTA